jgi:hypothetical protein
VTDSYKTREGIAKPRDRAKNVTDIVQKSDSVKTHPTIAFEN